MTPNTVVGTQHPPEGMQPSEAIAETTKETDVQTKPNEPVKNETPITTKGTVKVDDCPASPQFQQQAYHQAYLAHLTPQPGGGYYLYGSQVTPEPPSPATPGYDVNSFLQHQAALGVHPGNPFGSAGQYGGIPHAPLSPNRTSGLISAPSPLFPRAGGNYDQQNHLDSNVLQRIQGQTPASPSVPYMTASLGVSNGTAGFAPAYPGYAVAGSYATNVLGGGMTGGEPTADDLGWGERSNSQQSHYSQASPHQGPGMYPGMSRAGVNSRSYSFDEMLPPPALDQQDQASASYSPYSTSQPGSGNNLFTHQQPWGYNAAVDMYNQLNPPQSPLQSRQSPHMQGQFPGGHPGMMSPQMHHMGPYGGQHPMPPFYPATSPGPPIQTTASNKGPEGANLFIFHIPNHYTNLDMYRLFCQYGNLLSVRIMVEKDTGRSRGFGFVSYDVPESAALAIRELNGYAIGNKRLKVQHKQIRGDQMRGGFESPDAAGYMPHAPDFADESGEQMGISDSTWYSNSAPVGPYYETHDGQEHETKGNADAVGGVPEQASAPEDQSPLASLEPLRVALADVEGPVGTVE